MRKAYTEEEKNEIAKMYADGIPVSTIAEQFGRKPHAIQILVNKMGLKRGHKRVYEKPEVIASSDAGDQPKAKRECTLKKPWYLKSQVITNGKK